MGDDHQDDMSCESFPFSLIDVACKAQIEIIYKIEFLHQQVAQDSLRAMPCLEIYKSWEEANNESQLTGSDMKEKNVPIQLVV